MNIEVAFSGGNIPGSFLPALVVDDDKDYRETLAERLRQQGYLTDLAQSLDEALEAVKKKSYELIVCDNIFGEPGNLLGVGSRFLREHWDAVRSAKIILATGYARSQIEDIPFLEEQGVKIVQKARGHFKEIETVSGAAILEKTKRLESALSYACQQLIETEQGESGPAIESLRVGSRLATLAARRLVSYFSTLPGQGQKQFLIGQRTYSPAEIAQAIREGSDLGLELTDVLLEEILDADEDS